MCQNDIQQNWYHLMQLTDSLEKIRHQKKKKAEYVVEGMATRGLQSVCACLTLGGYLWWL